jgi:trehalose utilization protein
LIRITIWNEFRHEKNDQEVIQLYPNGIHEKISQFLSEMNNVAIKTATLDEPEHGLSAEVLDGTDVLLWWGHIAHGEVNDVVAARVQKRVLNGMGLIVLHSAHMSKVFTRLMGTTGHLCARDAGTKVRMWNLNPSHPIMAGVGDYIELEKEEMYGERFDIPTPDELLMISWYKTGEVFRSACCFQRGAGKIFFFQPGHETYPTYYNPQIQKVLKNAVQWAVSPRYEGNSHLIFPKPLEEV